MTKKDYITIARALNLVACNNNGDDKANELLAEVTGELAKELKFQNPRFNEDKFIDAVWKK